MGVLEIAVFEDDFDFLTCVVSEFGEHSEFVADIVPLQAEDLADVHHDIEFLAAVFESCDGFGAFDRGAVAAVGEANGGRGLDASSSQPFRAAFQVVGHDADASDIVGDRKIDSLFELTDGHGRDQQGVVDHLG